MVKLYVKISKAPVSVHAELFALLYGGQLPDEGTRPWQPRCLIPILSGGMKILNFFLTY